MARKVKGREHRGEGEGPGVPENPTGKQWVARRGSRYSNDDARVIGPVLNELAESNNNGFTPKDVVEVASDPESPIHRYFEWKDEVAGPLYRLDQARGMARSIQIRVITADQAEDEGDTVRAYHNIQDTYTFQRKEGDQVINEDVTRRRYVTLEMVKQVPDYQEQIIKRVLGLLRTFRSDFAQFSRFGDIQIVRRVSPLVVEMENILNGDDDDDDAESTGE